MKKDSADVAGNSGLSPEQEAALYLSVLSAPFGEGARLAMLLQSRRKPFGALTGAREERTEDRVLFPGCGADNIGPAAAAAQTVYRDGGRALVRPVPVDAFDNPQPSVWVWARTGPRQPQIERLAVAALGMPELGTYDHRGLWSLWLLPEPIPVEGDGATLGNGRHLLTEMLNEIARLTGGRHTAPGDLLPIPGAFPGVRLGCYPPQSDEHERIK